MFLLSVQHTGTRSLRAYLSVPGDHVRTKNMVMIRAMLRGSPIPPRGVVPMRDPALVYESWVRRERPIVELEEQYRNLIKLSEEFDLLFVDINTVPGDPVTNYNTVNIPITPEMQERVPGWVRNWYDHIELCTAREAAGDIRE